ncbi:MAG: periplasmic divalent cation tolerance protein [Paracoccaceae bacterium]|jgi:periplasmic divalent cation tolerance protein
MWPAGWTPAQGRGDTYRDRGCGGRRNENPSFIPSPLWRGSIYAIALPSAVDPRYKTGGVGVGGAWSGWVTRNGSERIHPQGHSQTCAVSPILRSISQFMGNDMPDRNDARLIYITTDGAEEARLIGRALVEARLAACANVLGPMTSIYRWEGAVQEGQEAVLIAKTTVALVDALTEKVRALDGYGCPCIVALPVDGGNPAFLDWIAAETRAE